ncbi:helix-turn-helix domain-containing protein [Hydrogenibacillus sp. N12]|nr:helix-turn-helix domain-containing protein [Hydrogenibacillus sp. N12]
MRTPTRGARSAGRSAESLPPSARRFASSRANPAAHAKSPRATAASAQKAARPSVDPRLNIPPFACLVHHPVFIVAWGAGPLRDSDHELLHDAVFTRPDAAPERPRSDRPAGAGDDAASFRPSGAGRTPDRPPRWAAVIRLPDPGDPPGSADPFGRLAEVAEAYGLPGRWTVLSPREGRFVFSTPWLAGAGEAGEALRGLVDAWTQEAHLRVSVAFDGPFPHGGPDGAKAAFAAEESDAFQRTSASGSRHAAGDLFAFGAGEAEAVPWLRAAARLVAPGTADPWLRKLPDLLIPGLGPAPGAAPNAPKEGRLRRRGEEAPPAKARPAARSEGRTVLGLSAALRRRPPAGWPDELWATVRALWAEHLSVSRAARRLGLHRNTLLYRIERIRQSSDLDPRRFDDAVALFFIDRLLFPDRPFSPLCSLPMAWATDRR